MAMAIFNSCIFVMEEIRKPIKWYEWYYDISNYGRVRSYWKRWNRWAILMDKPNQTLKWRNKTQTTIYTCHTLYKETDRKRHFKTSRLVAQAFLWLDYYDKKANVIFLDNDWTNNHISNLIIWTPSNRAYNSIGNGRRRK